MKHISFLIAIVIAALTAISMAQAATVTLKQKLEVKGDDITFGDIFDGAGEKSDYVIATSPAPGKTITFKVSSLAFVARKHGLDWYPRRSAQQITVFRKGQRIADQEIKEEIRNALERELQSGEFEMTLTSRSPNIQVATNETPSVSIESLSYNIRKENFSVIIAAPANSSNPTLYRLTGKMYPQVLVPVSARLLSSGTEITEKDLDYKLVRRSKVGRNVALYIDDIIGQSPKRSIRTGGTISLTNLGEPVTIAKGKIVSVTLKNGGIALSITGRALDNGATGDVIRIKNLNSQKVIQAQVINSQEVRIITPQQRLAAIRN